MGKISSRRRATIRKKLFNGRVEAPCYYCGISLDMKTATIEHVHPKSLGGSNKLSNLELACYSCNQAKSKEITKLSPDEYRFRAIKDCVRESSLNFDQICELNKAIVFGNFVDRKRLTKKKKKYTVVLRSKTYICHYNHSYNIIYKIENSP